MDQGMSNSLREEVFRDVKKKYNSEIEYLWARFPTYLGVDPAGWVRADEG